MTAAFADGTPKRSPPASNPMPKIISDRNPSIRSEELRGEGPSIRRLRIRHRTIRARPSQRSTLAVRVDITRAAKRPKPLSPEGYEHPRSSQAIARKVEVDSTIDPASSIKHRMILTIFERSATPNRHASLALSMISFSRGAFSVRRSVQSRLRARGTGLFDAPASYRIGRRACHEPAAGYPAYPRRIPIQLPVKMITAPMKTKGSRASAYISQATTAATGKRRKSIGATTVASAQRRARERQ